MHRILALVLVLFVLPIPPTLASGKVPVALRGSKASMQRQHGIAQQAGYPFARSATEMQHMVDSGALVRLTGNDDYTLHPGVSAPYARPEVRLFIERLAEQYHAGTGERLVVTSLSRPKAKQPRNAHALSVHPAGIAVDLRVSRRHASRAWLESVLLKLEREGVLDATRERYPPHYHVALFPEAYMAYLEAMMGPEALQIALAGPVDTLPPVPLHAAGLDSARFAALPADAPAPEPTRTTPLWVVPAALAMLFFVRRRRTSQS